MLIFKVAKFVLKHPLLTLSLIHIYSRAVAGRV